MTIDEFIQRLQAVDFDWEIRGGALRAQKGELNHCVASAVLDNIRAFTNPSEELHKGLGLSMIDAKTIVECADNFPTSLVRHFDPNVRKKLLKACKVTELER